MYFSFQNRMSHFESGQQVWYWSYSSIYTYPSKCGSQLFLSRSVGSRVASTFSHSLGCISFLGSSGGGSSQINHCQCFYTLEYPWNAPCQAYSFPIVFAVLTPDSWNYCSEEQGPTAQHHLFGICPYGFIEFEAVGFPLIF